MNDFDCRIQSATGCPLTCRGIDIIQANLGYRCNQCCQHCHVNASPDRTEVMEWSTMEAIIEAVKSVDCKQVDLTGGSPELNPHFRQFIEALREENIPVQVRTNLTVMLEPGMEYLPEFFRDHQVALVASMPCYLEENVDAQRGAHVYEKSIEVLKRLNTVGYGIEGSLPLNLVYNPIGPFLPPAQNELEADYKRELKKRFRIEFSHLLTITNMPIGRFLVKLKKENIDGQYRQLLLDAFNPETVASLMCRHQISIGWDGTPYDCDFNMALNLPVNHGATGSLSAFDSGALSGRRIVTGDHCFGCTAGCGSSCGGALVQKDLAQLI